MCQLPPRGCHPARVVPLNTGFEFERSADAAQEQSKKAIADAAAANRTNFNMEFLPLPVQPLSRGSQAHSGGRLRLGTASALWSRILSRNMPSDEGKVPSLSDAAVI